MAASLSGNHEVIRLKNFNNLASSKGFHVLGEGNFYVGNNRAFYSLW
jgi:hypothetical protein